MTDEEFSTARREVASAIRAIREEANPVENRARLARYLERWIREISVDLRRASGEPSGTGFRPEPSLGEAMRLARVALADLLGRPELAHGCVDPEAVDALIQVS